MKTQNFSCLKAELSLLETATSKSKPLSEDFSKLKELKVLQRRDAVFASLETTDELCQFTNLLINFIAPCKTVNDEIRRVVKQSEGQAFLEKVLTTNGDYSQLDNALLNSYKKIVTHNTKFNDTNNAQQVIAGTNNTQIDHGVYGGDITHMRSFSCINMPFTAAVFALEFVFCGSKTNLFQIVGDIDHPACNVVVCHLLELCENKTKAQEQIDNIQKFYNDWKDNNGFASTESTFNQILYPVDFEDYVALSPVPSTAMLQALRKMANNFFENELYVENKLLMQKIEVGGSKPQNAGDYNNSVAGRHYLLEAFVPNIYKKNHGDADQFVKSIAHRPTLFNAIGCVDNEWVDRYLKQEKIGFKNCVSLASMVATESTSLLVKAFLLVPKNTELSCSELEKQYVFAKSYKAPTGEQLSYHKCLSMLVEQYTESCMSIIHKKIKKKTGFNSVSSRHNVKFHNALSNQIKKAITNA